jgi:hypothetical protein
MMLHRVARALRLRRRPSLHGRLGRSRLTDRSNDRSNDHLPERRNDDFNARWPDLRPDLLPDRLPHRQTGMSMIETLIALPILLIVGLGALQFALILQARHALNFALIEAARAGSVDHADPLAIRNGLARGLLPWLHGAQGQAEYLQNLMRTEIHLLEGEAQGWVLLAQQSPTPESFDDWAEPARNANGELLEGVREIPNDNLSVRSVRMQPASGVAGLRGAEPIGQVSGQTLNDANLLRLRLDYGVPLVVPLVGRLMAWTLRVWDGCEALQSGGASGGLQPAARMESLGALRLPVAGPGSVGRLWPCMFYGLGSAQPSAEGVTQGPPRIPVRVSATVRMQSPARQAQAGALGMGSQSLSWYASAQPLQTDPGDPATFVPSTALELTGPIWSSKDQSGVAPPPADLNTAPAKNAPVSTLPTDGLLSGISANPPAFTAVPAADPAVCVIESRG